MLWTQFKPFFQLVMASFITVSPTIAWLGRLVAIAICDFGYWFFVVRASSVERLGLPPTAHAGISRPGFAPTGSVPVPPRTGSRH